MHRDMTTTQNKSACRKQHSDGSKPCSVPMPVAMQDAIIRRARSEDRSFSSVVRRALESYLSKPA